MTEFADDVFTLRTLAGRCGVVDLRQHPTGREA